jgi:golgi to ER traffic protein 4
VLGQLLYRWYSADDSFKVGHYAARAVLPYLLLNNVRDANKVLDIFSSNLTQNNKNLTNSLVESMTSEIRVFPSLPLFNFLRLLVLTVERGQADTFRGLRSHYGTYLNDVPDWNEVWKISNRSGVVTDITSGSRSNR